MKHGRLLLAAIFMIAILTAPSLAVKTVTYTSNLTPETVGEWTKYHTLPKFDPDLGNLISLYFTASLNATLNAAGENKNEKTKVYGAYLAADPNMYVDMINGNRISLALALATDPVDLDPFDGTLDFLGPSAFNRSDADDISGSISYNDAQKDNYVGKGTFSLKAYATATSTAYGSGNYASLFDTWAWSNASITYTYDECRSCISGYKKDSCNGALPGWDITVSNSTGYSETKTTDQNGKFEFCDLAPGVYTLTESLKPGWIKVSSPSAITLACNNATNQNFTNQKLLCISGFKKDSCNVALPGWDITVSNSTGYSETKTTDQNGKFEFCDLAPGVYTLTESLKPGWIKVSSPSAITLACNNATNQNFTNQKLLCISGFKKDSCNVSLPGWDITVSNSTGYTQTKTTDQNGKFEFCSLSPGVYTLTESLKPGWIKVSSPSAITLACNNATNQNFSNQKLLCISGYKINSSSGAGLPGWNITLTNSSGSVTAKTGADGKYQFCNLLPGSYSLTEEIVPGYLVVQKVSNPFTLSCVDLTNKNFTNKWVPNLCGECWPRGRPQYLAMTYTGKNCIANCNVQAAGKVIVTGDPAGATSVHIVVRDSSPTGTVWFDGTVAVGSTFVIDPSKVVAGATFGTNTFVRISDSSDKELSTIYFHTSCSQPLRPGDMYGSLRLEGCTGTEPTCPTATDDAYNALNDTTLTVAAANGVLANDNGQEITIVSNTQPGNGTVLLKSDGSFTYVPKAGYCGTDRFSYKITGGGCDAGYQDEANVTLNVRCLWCQVSGAEALTFSGKQVSWKITNIGAGPQDISSIYLAWPSVNKKEVKVMLNGVEIYSPDLAAPSATINSGWKGTVAARTIGPGQTATLTFEFETNVCTDQSGYACNVQFSSGCSANLAAAGCQAAGGSALTISGKQVSWTITNSGGTPLDIGGIDLVWPQENGKEMKVTLGGVEIYSPDLAPASASFCSGWKGTQAVRTIQPGQTSTLAFEFEKTASTSQSGYSINVRLNPGCSLSFP